MDDNNDLERIEFKDEIIDLSEANESKISPHFITIDNEEYQKKKKRKRERFKLIVAAGITTVSLATLSVGLLTGLNLSNKYINQREKTSFKFDSLNINSDSDEDASLVFLSKTNSVAPIVKKVSDSVVNISVKMTTTNIFYQMVEGTGSGSGVIFNEDNENVYIVTNNHVIDGAKAVSVSISGEEELSAHLVGKDVLSDIAVISISKADLSLAGIQKVTVASFGNSDEIEVGEYVLAVGNALGEGKTVTQGIISARNKTLNIDGRKISVLQTDAAINPGNSGGALVDTDGEVIGINTAKLSSSAVEGIGYAIPSNNVKSIIDSILENKGYDRPYLGIAGFTITDSFRQTYNINIEGVFITRIEEGTVAASSGLKPSDIIVSFKGEKVTEIEELSNMIMACKGNETVEIGIIRNGYEPLTINVTFGSETKSF